MNRQEIFNALCRVIVRELHLEDIKAEDLTEDMPLFGEGLGLDSIDAVELVVILEKHFQVAVKDAQETRTAFTSLGGLVTFIQERMHADA
ncbi:MAG: phosphopantetheine-binding protein [Deltaproteobacteria bacterium]|jgi:acyl carrier protein|nr:phosphopantetheine-binding protein [Deltaproteobacteria bacterium]